VYDLAPGGAASMNSPARAPGTLAPLGRARTALRLTVGGLAVGVLVIGVGLALTRVLAHSGLAHADLHAERWLAAHRSRPLDHVTSIATWLAETPTAIAVAVVAFVALRLWLHRWRESWVVAVALVGELLIFLAATALVDRPRPPVHRLDAAPPTSSFPSGHTGAAVAIYGTLAVVLILRGNQWPVGRAVGGILAVLPAVVGAARLYRGMHYPTDVLAGALNGTLWLVLAFTTLLPRPADARKAL
jgi:membrane-associated phospholipid phosphatase